VNVEVGVEINANLSLPDIHYESRRRRFRIQQYNRTTNIEDSECYEDIIDLLDFEDVFEYFDEVESLIEQTVLESVDLPTNMLKRSLSAIETSLVAEALA